jgi:hypothetical protein
MIPAKKAPIIDIPNEILSATSGLSPPTLMGWLAKMPDSARQYSKRSAAVNARIIHTPKYAMPVT